MLCNLALKALALQACRPLYVTFLVCCMMPRTISIKCLNTTLDGPSACRFEGLLRCNSNAGVMRASFLHLGTCTPAALEHCLDPLPKGSLRFRGLALCGQRW